MRAVILAAGAAKRLSPHTDNIPKCLIEIGNKSILEMQLDNLKINRVTEVAIVVGYLKEMIMERYSNTFNGMNLTFIENPDYLITNTVYSLWLVRNFFNGNNFLYLNGDVLFHPDIIQRLLRSEHDTCLAVEKKVCGEEEVKVATDKNNRITGISKKITSDASVGEFIGVSKFHSGITEDFIRHLETVVSEGNKTAFFEAALDRLLRTHAIYLEDITDIPSIEIDFPEDLEQARNIVLPRILAYPGSPDSANKP